MQEIFSWGTPQHENLGQDVGIGVVFARIVMAVLGDRLMRGAVLPASARNPGWKRPDSSSLMETEAVMCMAFTSASQYLQPVTRNYQVFSDVSFLMIFISTNHAKILITLG